MSQFQLHLRAIWTSFWSGLNPFQKRISRLRKIFGTLVLLFLLLIIGAYFYITHSDRVRLMAQGYLSDVIGGTVQIQSVHLSLLEGFWLHDVKVLVANDTQPDALIFSAKSFHLNYNIHALLRGKFQVTRILAIQPHIRLVRNLDTGTSNYQHLFRNRRASATSRPAGEHARALPEIVLKNGQLENGLVQDGKYTELSATWFDGRLTTAGPGGKNYFNLQSRADGTSTAGPELAGWFDPKNGEVQLALRGVDFGPQLQAMLPNSVRDWCRQHQLDGRLSIDNFTFIPGRKKTPPVFDVHMRLETVSLSLPSQQWRSRNENHAVRQLRGVLSAMQGFGVGSDSLLSKLTRFAEAPPVRLENLHGSFNFSSTSGISIDGLGGRIEGNEFELHGRIADYSAESAFHLELSSPRDSLLWIGADPRYIRSLPLPVEEIYDRFKPRGTCRLDLRIDRPIAGAKISVAGAIDIVNGQFTCDHFPYPLRDVHGELLILQNQTTGHEMLKVESITGRGIAGGPNADRTVSLTGDVGPFNHKCKVHLVITGQGISSEPAIFAALPPETHGAMKFLDAPGHGKFPTFHGDFVCTVDRPPVEHAHWAVATDLKIDQSSARLVAFPYPLDNVSMVLKIRDDFLDIVGAHMQKGQSSLTLNGRVSWTKPTPENPKISVHPDLTISAKNVPIDSDLLNAMPAARARWIRAAGLVGSVDIDGRIAEAVAGDQNQRGGQVLLAGHQIFLPTDEVDADLHLQLHQGKLLPVGNGQYAITGITAQMHLTPDHLTIGSLTGHRGSATATGAGSIAWGNKNPAIDFAGSVANLLLDPPLRKLLPSPAKKTWSWLDPMGTVDGDFVYSQHGPLDWTHDLQLTVRPRNLSITPSAIAYRLDHLTGSASFSAGHVTLKNLTGRHGSATILLSGAGVTEPALDWQLHLRGQHIDIDHDFMTAAPKPLETLISSLDLKGQFDFDFSKLAIRSDSTGPSTGPAVGPTASTDTRFVVSISTPAASMNAGLPIRNIAGRCTLSGGFHGGKTSDLTGNFTIDSLNVDRRTVNDIEFKLKKTADAPVVALYDLSATMAGGSVAGQLSVVSPENRPAHYTLGIVLRDADIAQLAPDAEHDMRGQFSASIDLEGAWSDPASRRGRGDVLLTGKDLYKIPILLGVSQIANLSLPISEPFTQGTARYAVQGSTVIFDSIELKANNMTMTGSGQMDFSTKKFSLVFTTGNPNWPKLPIISDLVQGAEHQLFQIHVNGTIQEPRVSAGLLGVVPTTIDQVIGKKQ